MRDLSNQIVFITGGASGIGRGLAERFGAAGARCFIADVNQDLVREAARSMGCTGVALDVCDAGQVRAVIEGITREHGPIDFLVNSAGIVRAGETHLFEYDDWKRVLDVNLYGVVNCIHAVYPEMVRRRAGHIVNIASIAGLFPSAGQVSYVASKSAVVGLSHALRVEAAAHGVKVSVACPGIIDTPMTRGFSVKSKNPRQGQEPDPAWHRGGRVLRRDPEGRRPQRRHHPGRRPGAHAGVAAPREPVVERQAERALAALPQSLARRLRAPGAAPAPQSAHAARATRWPPAGHRRGRRSSAPRRGRRPGTPWGPPHSTARRRNRA